MKKLFLTYLFLLTILPSLVAQEKNYILFKKSLKSNIKDSVLFYFESWIQKKEYNLDSLLILYADDELDSLSEKNWEDFDLEQRIKELYFTQISNIEYKEFSFLVWKMKGKDQRFRTYNEYISPKLKQEVIFLDSILKINVSEYIRLMNNWTSLRKKDELIVMNWINENGFPSISKVGNIASDASFLIIQHSGNNKYYKKYLKMMKKALKLNDGNKEKYALMFDRYLLLKKRKQYFATQQLIKKNDSTIYYLPIKNIKHLNKRRAKMNLTPLNLDEIKISKP